MPGQGRATPRDRGRRRLLRDRRRRPPRPRRLSHDAADPDARAGGARSATRARTSAYLPGSSSRASCASSRPAWASAARRPRLPRRPVARPREVIAGARGRGPAAQGARSCRWRRGSCRPHGAAPTVMLTERLGAPRVACIGGPAHAREMVSEGAGLVAASIERGAGAHARRGLPRARASSASSLQRPDRRRAGGRGQERRRAGGGRDEAQGLNAAGAAAGHIFARGLALRRVARAPGRSR